MKWPTYKLAKLCSVVTKGTTPRTLGKEYVSMGIPFLRAENLQGDEVVLNNKTLFIDENTNKLLSRSIIYPDDVLISIAGTIGRCAIVPCDAQTMNCNQAVAIARISGPLDRRYLLHWLKTSDAQIQMKGGKVTQTISNLSLTQVKNLKVPLPPISEQRRIVEILDQAKAQQQKRSEADEKSTRILPAIFYKMFGDPGMNPMEWKLGKLDNIIKDTRNGLYKPAKFYGSGIGILKMFNIQNGELDLSRIDQIETSEEEYEAYCLLPGDILINRVNTPGLVGKCAVITEEVGKAVFESKNIRLRVKSNKVTPEFIAHYLNSPYGYRAIRSGVKHAIGMATINNTDLRNTPVILPPIEIQNKWASIVKDFRKLRAKNSASKIKINELFKNLIHRAFTGGLTAPWRQAHMKELLQEMELQAKALAS